MNALETKFERWERKNIQQLELLGEFARTRTEEAVTIALRFFSLILFIGFAGARIAGLLIAGILETPKMVRLVAPDEKPIEREEFDLPKNDFRPGGWL